MKFSRMSLFTGCVLVVTLCWFLYPSTTLGSDDAIAIDIAPNVLNIQSESVVVTVHTDIAYSVVDGATVSLNGAEIDYWKSDARGNFVAKFLSDDIKYLDGLIINDYNMLVLEGFTTGGESFIGMQDIKVIDIMPQGKN